MIPEVQIRPEEARDRVAIRTIHETAFGQPAEADLVDRLRANGNLVLSLVALAEEPVGHIAFSRLILADSDCRATALAPLAVAPERQRQGVGAFLVREGLKRLGEAGEHLVLVLGDPAYYGRFGFAADAARGLATPYDGPYLQALSFGDRGAAAHGLVRYAGAFAELA